MSKDKLRQRFLQQRQALDWIVWQRKSQDICQRIQACPWFMKALTILAYYPHQQEPDLRPLFQQCHQVWGLPRIEGKTLIWHWFQPDQSPLHPDPFGILTPAASCPTIAPEAVDLILVPCVAVDRRGYRLGYGGGFYDRMLGSLAWQGVKTLGIVFDQACVEELPTEAWDIPLKGYCSDQEMVIIAP